VISNFADRAANKDQDVACDAASPHAPGRYKRACTVLDPAALGEVRDHREELQRLRDKLGAGQIAMFEKYPDWKMIVYPTHRSASFPQRIYDTSIKNAATGELVDDGEGVDQVAEGFPSRSSTRIRRKQAWKRSGITSSVSRACRSRAGTTRRFQPRRASTR